MALSATVYKINLQIADMDRHYYHDHALTLARHPSETDERLMVRVLAFARHASESLSFAHGRLGAAVKSSEDEPDLWEKDLTGAVELWIEVGLPDERSIRQACNRAKQVVVYAYGGHKVDRWWKHSSGKLEKVKNLSIFNLSPENTSALAKLSQGDLNLNCNVQDGDLSIGDESGFVQVEMMVMKKNEGR